MASTKKIVLSGIVASGILATSGLLYAASGSVASTDGIVERVAQAAGFERGPMGGHEGRERGMGGGFGFMMAPTVTQTDTENGTGELRQPPVDSEIAALDNDATKALREKYQAQAKPIVEEIQAGHEKLEALAESFSGELATVNPALKAKLDERASEMRERGPRGGRMERTDATQSGSTTEDGAGRMGHGMRAGAGMADGSFDPAKFLSKIEQMPQDRAVEMLTRMSEGFAKQIEKTTDATEKTKLEGYKSAVDAALVKLNAAS